MRHAIMGAEAIQHAVMNLFQSWQLDHPILGWGLSHPVWLIVIGAVAVFLLWGLLRAIAQLTEKVWVMLLRAPLRIGQWCFRRLRGFMRRVWPKPNDNVSRSEEVTAALSGEVSLPVASDLDRQIQDCLLQLVHLQQEQMQLLQRIQVLLEQTKSGARNL
ncbi:MAG TPA: hypothetical protein V6D19_11450 [Stenomitos sp.]